MREGRTKAVRELGQIVHLGIVSGMTDAELVEQFVAGSTETATLAFEAIVERHGPMVSRVCQMVLHDLHAAEDAFQATFLVLARKARTLGVRELLNNWLYRVALRTARKVKSVTTRRRLRELEIVHQRSIKVAETPCDGEFHDVGRILCEEIERLPESYRAAVLICYLEGMTQAGAALKLGLAESTVRGRLARARKLLRRRLTHRGVTLSTGLLGPYGLQHAGAIPLPQAMAVSTARAALAFLKPNDAMSGTASSSAERIANGVLATMRYDLFRAVGVVLSIVGLTASGAAVMMQRPAAAGLPTGLSSGRSGSEVRTGAVVAVYQPSPPQQNPLREGRSRGKAGRAESVEVDKELVGRVPGPIVRALPLSKDCMILSYMPDWNFGNIDNFGLANNDGGVRILIEWPDIPSAEAASAERKFLIAIYSHTTTSNPPAGAIHAFEIVEDWPERTSWRTQPRYDPEPKGTYRFERGNGWKLFDVTPLVRAQAQAHGKSHGVLLRFLSEDFSGGANPTFSGYRMVSREGGGKQLSRRPLLLIVKVPKG